MTPIQATIILGFGIYSALVFAVSYYQTKRCKNAYGEQPLLYLNGSFVYGDGIVFGLFWIAITSFTLVINDFILFLLSYSVFWLVRSLGETIFWLLQQYSTVRIYPAERLPFFSLYQNNSIWFFNQIWNQCITVISVLTTIYLAHLWLQKL